MEEGLFLRRIREEFPDITWTSHRYLTHGWDHAALILDDALVFRAPKAPAYRGALAQEARLLRHLRPRVKVGIPGYTHRSADGSFAGYPLLAGRELDVGAFHQLDGVPAAVRRHEVVNMAGEAIVLLRTSDRYAQPLHALDAWTQAPQTAPFALLDATLALDCDGSWLRQALPPVARRLRDAVETFASDTTAAGAYAGDV